MLAGYQVQIEKLDRAAMLASLPRRNAVLTALLRVLTWTGHGWAWAIAVALLAAGVLPAPERNLTLYAALAAGIAWVVVAAIKKLVRRRRPFQVIDDFPRLTPAPIDDSFPSGHAASAFAFLTAMTPLGPAVTLPIAVWCALVAFSRYYLGVHFPSDILVGALIGVVSGAALLL